MPGIAVKLRKVFFFLQAISIGWEEGFDHIEDKSFARCLCQQRFELFFASY